MESEITVNVISPGLMTDTNFAPDKSRFTEAFLEGVADRIGSLDQSAKKLASMMTAPQYEKITGKYFDRGIERLSSTLSYNRENAAELWEMSVEYTHLASYETLPGLLNIG